MWEDLSAQDTLLLAGVLPGPRPANLDPASLPQVFDPPGVQSPLVEDQPEADIQLVAILKHPRISNPPFRGRLIVKHQQRLSPGNPAVLLLHTSVS